MNEVKKELNENEVVEMIYEKINEYWGKFPNLWKYVTKDDMAAASALDLYRPRKDSGIPNIVYYNNTKGDRSLKPLIGLVVYNVLMHEARFIHSTGIYNNEARRNVYNTVSLETPIREYCECDAKDITLGDTLSDSTVDVDKEVSYSALYDSIPDVDVERVYYKYDNVYVQFTYKSLLNDIMNGYKLSQVGDMLYRKNKKGEYHKFRDVNIVAKKMKRYMRKFLATEYNYDVRDYNRSWSIL